MTTISEKRDQAMARVRRLKELRVADWRETGRPELHPTVIGWRGVTEVVVMVAADVDRDEGLRAAEVAATGFGCDSLAFCVDTWGTTERVNPTTGREWGPREMQDVVENHQGLERGWITESLSVFVVNRAGDLAAGYQGYRQTRGGYGKRTIHWTLEWTEAHTADGDVTHEGLVTDRLLRYMNRPNMLTSMAKIGLGGAAFGLDDVETMAHADCAVVKSLQAAGWAGAVLLTAEDPKRRAIIDRSLGELGEGWKGWGAGTPA